MARSKNGYKLPLNKKEIVAYSNTRLSPAHAGKLRHAIDFACYEGTPIHAAASGVVVWLKDDSSVGGPDRKEFWLKGNRIVIKHNNGEYTAYEHLKYKGSKVKVGQKVRQGELIGYSGNTGFSYFPHLHFEVFNKPSKDESEGTTLQVWFHELNNGYKKNYINL